MRGKNFLLPETHCCSAVKNLFLSSEDTDNLLLWEQFKKFRKAPNQQIIVTLLNREKIAFLLCNLPEVCK